MLRGSFVGVKIFTTILIDLQLGCIQKYKISNIEDDKIVVDSVDLEFDYIVEEHSNMFWSLLDCTWMLLSIIVLLVELDDDRFSCL